MLRLLTSQTRIIRHNDCHQCHKEALKGLRKYVNYDHPGECSPDKDCLR